VLDYFLSTPGLPFSGLLSHIPHEENPDANEQKHGKPVDQECLPHLLGRLLGGVNDLRHGQNKASDEEKIFSRAV
jgi:hypothetical protein